MDSSLPTGCEVRCPGCSHRSWSAEESQAQKLHWIQSCLQSWENKIQPIHAVQGWDRWGYRQRVCLHAQWKEGRWNFGLLKGHYPEQIEVIDIADCPLHSSDIRLLTKKLSKLLPGFDNFPLVYLMISGKLLTFVLKTNYCRLREMVELSSAWNDLGLTGVFINFNPSAGHRVTSSRGWSLLWGQDHEIDQNGLVYGPDSFQQLIPALHQDAMQEVVQFFQPVKTDAILDFYSGIGRTLRIWKQFEARTLGIELSGDAVRCGVLNVGKDFYLRGRVSDRIPQVNSWVENAKSKRLLLYANPPRIGLGTEVLNWISNHLQPDLIAYLSCSAGTLSKDLESLTHSGYSVKRIIPYDFFPQTHHVETLVLLAKMPST